MAYEQVTGTIGSERDDLLTGIVGSTIANANRGKGQKALKPADFIPLWDGKPEQTWEEQLAIVTEMNKVFGGDVVTREKDT